MRPAGEEFDRPLGEARQGAGAEPPDESASEEWPHDVQTGNQLPGAEGNAEQPIDEVAEVPDVGREDAAGRGEERDQNDVADYDSLAPLARGRLCGHR
jgi:hypothetical protein